MECCTEPAHIRALAWPPKPDRNHSPRQLIELAPILNTEDTYQRPTTIQEERHKDITSNLAKSTQAPPNRTTRVQFRKPHNTEPSGVLRNTTCTSMVENTKRKAKTRAPRQLQSTTLWLTRSKRYRRSSNNWTR